jgi:pectinesterase
MTEILVNNRCPGDNNSEYISLTEAIASLSSDESEHITIKIAPGEYYEKIELRRGNVTIEGTGSEAKDTLLFYDDCARQDMPDGSKRGTFRSYSFFIDASNVTIKNLTIANTSGSEDKAWQAIALYADGDNLKFENVRLLGHQDTLFTGPLPPKEIQPGGFIGPKQFDERINGRHHYKNCYICGNVDFIFGSATALFEDCVIESIARAFEVQKKSPTSESGSDKSEKVIHGYVTAPSTPEGQKYGYVFKGCTFISNECPEGSVYLGRPWRDYAKSVFIDCVVGDHICAEGFHDWNKPHARECSCFAAFGCFRPDGDAYAPTAEFARDINEEELDELTREKILAMP